MIDQIKRFLLLIKEYWEYSIVIVPIILFYFFGVILVYFLSVKPYDIKIPQASFFFVLSFVVLTLVICLLITNIRHKNETKKQLFYRYYKVGLILPVLFLIFIPILSVISGERITLDIMFWFAVSFFIMGTITVSLSIAIGYLIRFIMTVRSSSTFFSFKLRIITVLFLSVLTIFLLWTGARNDWIASKNADSISKISFSPDSKKIIFNRIKGESPDMIHVYDLETKDLIAYQPFTGENWSAARYSFDGGKIAFVIVPRGNKYFEHDKAQLAVMDTDRKNIRKITNTDGHKNDPSFSHSGRKIIFSRSDVIRKDGRTSVAGVDVYEVDVETGHETRLTYFKFLGISNPYYFPDDKTFVFSGGYPNAYPAIPDSEGTHAVMDKVRKELKSKYQDNSIYVMQGNEKELKPYLVMPEYQKKFKMYVAGSENSRWPSLSADGSVLIFKAQGYKPDGSADFDHLYQYSPDGNHRSITRIPWTESTEAVSPNGEMVAIVSKATKYIDKILIYQVKDGASRKITLPDQPLRIINGN